MAEPKKEKEDRCERQAMGFAIDHLFICTCVGAPAAQRLIDLGLTEGEGNRHPGQGTQNRRFFFHNAMLELLWVCDSAEAQSTNVRPTKLHQRWLIREQCSPFGVCLRADAQSATEPPFSSWEYRPSYLPENLVLHIGADLRLNEPMWFFLGLAGCCAANATETSQPMSHGAGMRELTAVDIRVPHLEKPSPTAQAVIQTGLLTYTRGPDHQLELTFDDHAQRRDEDLRPDLPLVIRW